MSKVLTYIQSIEKAKKIEQDNMIEKQKNQEVQEQKIGNIKQMYILLKYLFGYGTLETNSNMAGIKSSLLILITIVSGGLVRIFQLLCMGMIVLFVGDFIYIFMGKIELKEFIVIAIYSIINAVISILGGVICKKIFEECQKEKDLNVLWITASFILSNITLIMTALSLGITLYFAIG